MANISINTDVNISITLSNEEIETLKKAYDVLKSVAKELWQNDAEETETFGNVHSAKDGIYYFMKNDCDVNVDNERYW